MKQILLLVSKTGTMSNAVKNFAIADTASVNKIFMANKDNVTVLLERNPEKGWTVNGQWEASQSMINLMLTTIGRIRPVNPLHKGATENIIKRLSYNATKVEIYGTEYRVDFWGMKLFPHEKLLKCYYVGDVTQDNMGTYMLMDGSDMPFIVALPGFRGYVASRYSVIPNEWRTHTIFDVGANEIENVRIENTSDADNSYIINTVVSSGKFEITTLAGDPLSYKVDSLKVYNYLNSFRRINYEAIVSEENEQQFLDSLLNTSPIYLITLKQKNGTSQSLKIYPLVYSNILDLETNSEMVDQDRCYAYMDNGEVVMIQYFTFDKILRPRSYFYLQNPKKQ